MNQNQQRPVPLTFASEKDMPYADVALATMEWNQTGTWRYLRPGYVERIPPCQGSCPTSNDIEKWIRLFEKGDFEGAWDAATLENPFPAIMGRVCFHPCMDGCNRCEMGGAVNINLLERTLGDAAGSELPVAKPFFKSTGKKIAVIGSGPSGLACAYHLTRLGHEVTIFEKEKHCGGMLRYGIPSYRLPKEVLDREIDRLKKMGVHFELSKPVKDAGALQSLKQDFNAVFIAVGAQKSKQMNIPGEKTSGVMSGLQFLWNLSEGKDPKVGKRVLVIGGGNTAIDAARSAIRLGSDVTMLYRRSKAEMPASEEEIAEAEREGVKMEMLTAPLAVIVKNARVAGLECQKMELGAPDETGRRRPVPVEGSKMVLDADTVIGAIGENVDTSIIPSAMGLTAGSIATNIGGRTDWQNVFAGGDATMQSRTVVDAIGGAKRSAIAMDCFLRGENFENIFDKICVADTDAVLMSRYIEYRTGIAHPVSTTSETEKLNEIVKFDELNPAYFQESAPLDTPSISVNERLSNNAFKEVHRPPTETEKFGELARCFHCGRCTECDNCFIYCPDVAIAKKTKGFDIDLFFCKGCGVCAVECPRAALRMTEEPTELE